MYLDLFFDETSWFVNIGIGLKNFQDSCGQIELVCEAALRRFLDQERLSVL